MHRCTSEYVFVLVLELGHSLIRLFLYSEKFETKDVRWAPDGKGFILLGKDQFCCAFEVSDNDGIGDV